MPAPLLALEQIVKRFGAIAFASPKASMSGCCRSYNSPSRSLSSPACSLFFIAPRSGAPSAPPPNRIEGPIIGTLVFFALRQTLADLGTIYLMMLGLVAIVIMLAAPKGIWGMIVERLGWQLFPLERTVLSGEPQRR